MSSAPPFFPSIVAIGGTTTPGSSTECALKLAVAAAERAGADTRVFDGAAISRLPHYGSTAVLDDVAQEFIAAVRAADGMIIASPGYHGSISGLVKNAIDHIEALARDERPYLDGMPVGLIATAYGWQATGSTLAALRSIVHALRGWPTPFGAAINTSGGLFKEGACTDAAVNGQLETVGQQVLDFTYLQNRGAYREHLDQA